MLVKSPQTVRPTGALVRPEKCYLFRCAYCGCWSDHLRISKAKSHVRIGDPARLLYANAVGGRLLDVLHNRYRDFVENICSMAF